MLRPVHDRMPVILHPEDYELWLNEDASQLTLVKELLRPYPASEMVSYPVSTMVNNTSNAGVELTSPLNSA